MTSEQIAAELAGIERATRQAEVGDLRLALEEASANAWASRWQAYLDDLAWLRSLSENETDKS